MGTDVDALSFARSVGRISLAAEVSSETEFPDDGREYVADDGFFNGIKTAMNTSLTNIRPLLCHGHVAMIRINRALQSFGWINYPAAQLLYDWMALVPQVPPGKGTPQHVRESVRPACQVPFLGF